MRATRSVLIPNPGKLFFPELRRQLDQSWPEAAVHIGNLPLDELADEDVRALGHVLRHSEDLMRLRMAPPTPSYWASNNSFCQAGDRSACSLQHDAVTLDEGQAVLWSHAALKEALGFSSNISS